ncbi:MAG: hypothetical protein LBU48_05430, partial [Coriobacteriales bacterium]|nr:hypothetical protein [Coriobacteriales bacterium]
MRFPKKRIIVSLAVGLVLGLAAAYGCAPQQTDSAENAAAQEAAPLTIAWSLESDCGICHTTQASSMEDDTATAGMHRTAVDAQLTCVFCHTDEAGMAGVHEDVEVEPDVRAFLKRTEVPSESCTASGCHDTDEAARREATATLTTFTDSKGTVI